MVLTVSGVGKNIGEDMSEEVLAFWEGNEGIKQSPFHKPVSQDLLFHLVDHQNETKYTSCHL